MSETRKACARLLLRGLAVTAGVLLCIFALPFAWKVLSPFVIALCVAAMLQPAIRLAVRKLKMRRGIAVFIAVFLLCAVAVLLLYWFISFAVAQILSALQNAPDIITGLINTLQAVGDKLIGSLEHVPASVSEWLTKSLSSGYVWLYNWAVGLAGSVVSGTVDVALELPQALIYANFLLLAICFITSGYDRLQKFFPGQNPNTLLGKLRVSAGAGMIGYIRVQLIYTAFVLLVSWLYLQLWGFQYSVLIAMVAALLELLPLFGNGTLYIPWIIICLILGDVHTAIVMLALHLFLYMTRKITEPRLMSDKMGLSPLSSLLSMFIGMKVGGVLGLTFAPVVGVVIVNAWRSGLFEHTLRDLRTLSSAVHQRLEIGDFEGKE